MTDNSDAFQNGRDAERERIKSILELPEAHGREGVALTLAMAPGMPAATARLILNDLPADPAPTSHPHRTQSEPRSARWLH